MKIKKQDIDPKYVTNTYVGKVTNTDDLVVYFIYKDIGLQMMENLILWNHWLTDF